MQVEISHENTKKVILSLLAGIRAHQSAFAETLVRILCDTDDAKFKYYMDQMYKSEKERVDAILENLYAEYGTLNMDEIL